MLRGLHIHTIQILACTHLLAHTTVRFLHVPLSKRHVAVWHCMHAMVNVVIGVLCIPAFLRMWHFDPNSCISDDDAAPHEFSVFAPGANSPLPIFLAVWLHVWHCAFFRITSADAMHHAVFLPTIGVPGTLWDWGSCGNAQLFFVCGFPGAVLYTLVVLRYCSYTIRRGEPAVTALVTTCVRMPGVLMSQYNLWLAYRHDTLRGPALWAVGMQLMLGPTNAVYYAFETTLRWRSRRAAGKKNVHSNYGTTTHRNVRNEAPLGEG